MKFKIGNAEIKNNVLLAPMAGITDKSFRAICSKMGCGLTYSEMISAKGLNYKNENTKTLLDIHEDEENAAIQLFGRDENILAQMALEVSQQDIKIIDINMGCPAPKIVKNFEGSALMKEPAQIGKIIYETARKSKVPITVKIRKGFDNDNINAVEIAKIAEEMGASAITVHGRTREEFYSGHADWEIIKKVKEAVKIPVIGNGDIVDCHTALKMLTYTNCDAIMIGRGAQGNPWIFKEIIHFLETGEVIDKPSHKEVIETALLQIRMTIDHKGEEKAIKEMRKHLGDYIKNMPNATKMRKKINTLNDYDEVEREMYSYLDSVNHPSNSAEFS